MTQRSYPQPFPAMLRKGCGKMAMDNSRRRTTVEESERPPLPSCSKMSPPLTEQKSGHVTCYKTGQVYLLLTPPAKANRPMSKLFTPFTCHPFHLDSPRDFVYDSAA